MDKLLAVFIDTTARINQMLDNLAELGLTKQQMIIRGQIQELDKLIHQEGIIVSNLEKLEGARFKLQAEIAVQWNEAAPELSAARLLEHLKLENSQYYSTCKEQTELLARNLTRLKAINQENDELINQSLDYIDVMQSLLGEDVAGTYTDRGLQTEPKHPHPRLNMLDKKA
jgi:hypothetical protein